MTKVYLRSDNAAYYLYSPLILLQQPSMVYQKEQESSFVDSILARHKVGETYVIGAQLQWKFMQNAMAMKDLL